MRQLTHFIILISTFTLVSCSVKESRDACPCRVGLDFLNLLPRACDEGEIISTITDADGKTLWSKRIGTDTCVARREILLPKGIYTVTSLLTGGGMVCDTAQGLVALRRGAEADSLYGEAATIDARGEEAESVPLPLKQFATFSIIFTQSVSELVTEVGIPSSHIRATDLSAVESPSSLIRTVSGTEVAFRLPRQCCEELSVAFSDDGGRHPVASVDLAPLLRRNGYEFNARELSDITLIMDFLEGRASIEVEGWKESLIIVTF
ncbi:MAG: hypothetical protein J5699_00105 [Bacteroidales bacterium]|nr:hypothetical protein [Bacteroidales bacterium]